MLEISDYELVKKCLQGETELFSELVGRYKKLVYSTVYYYTKDRQDADDLSQEVFLRLYKSLGNYNPEFKFSTWTIRITKNLCVDFMRKRHIASVSIDEFESLSREEDTPERKYLHSEKSKEIRQAINELPEKYKTLILLYHQNGASYKEMADKLGQPMSIIKNRLFRARLILRERLLGMESAC